MTRHWGVVKAAFFLVCCPECGASVSNPDTGSQMDTIETLEQVEDRSTTSANEHLCHMCHECGTFFAVIVPDALRDAAARHDDKAWERVTTG